MSLQYECNACGMIGETSWGGETDFCNRCSETTEYNPKGIENPEVEQKVDHLYFTGQIQRVVSEHTVYVLAESNRKYLDGQEIEIDPRFLSPR